MPSPRDEYLFCRLVSSGEHVQAAGGFVATRDVHLLTETHLLVLPERHVGTFRDAGEFSDSEAARMLRFVSDAASWAGLEDHSVVGDVGHDAGKTVFRLHRHVLGGDVDAERVARALAEVPECR